MKTILILGILLMTFAVYLHCTQLKDYDKENSNPDIDYGPTWLLRDSLQAIEASRKDTSKTMDETKK